MGGHKVAVVVTTAVTLVAAIVGGCSPGGVSRTVSSPDTPAGRQLQWLISSLTEVPVSEQIVREHVDPGYLEVLRGPATVNDLLTATSQWLGRVPAASPAAVPVDDPTMVVGVVAGKRATRRVRIGVTVTSRDLIADLDISAAATEPAPQNWAAVDTTIEKLGPQARLFIGAITGDSCQPTHRLGPDGAAAMGSVLKLYVLYALGLAVADGDTRWDQQLTLTAPDRSLPTGVLQYEPNGHQISVLEAARKMIFLSDNTATDLLVRLVGRTAVEDALTRAGMTDPARNIPFLTTRESYILSLQQWPALADRYRTADEPGRRQILADVVADLPLPTPAQMAQLRGRSAADSLSGHASGLDICRLYAHLRTLSHRDGLSPLADILGFADDILDLDPARWQTTWRKGGVGPGVVAHTFLAVDRRNRAYVAVALVDDPTAAARTAGPLMCTAVRGALDLTSST